jgi:ATP-dependent RNA helicase DeaD
MRKALINPAKLVDGANQRIALLDQNTRAMMCPESEIPLTTLPIPAPLAKALADRGYAELTPVQSAVLTPEAAERDLLVSAQTGSGKTVAFGIGIGSTLLGETGILEPAADPLALIVAPTRELAMQVQRELEWLYAAAGARVIACVGGMDPRRERRLLDSGAHIVVGTPGRLKDHIERKSLLLGDVRAVVLDEADEMLDLGFRDDLEFILQTTPETRRTLLFSATLPKGIVALAGKFQRNAHRIAAAGGERGHADIEYRALRVHPREIDRSIVNVLRHSDSPASLVFCNTRDGVRHLQATLVERGFSAVYLSGELSQNERNQSLQALRDGRAKICVATDVAARGIDLPNLGLVIHADLPLNAEIMQHRSGRTGRAGRKGISILVVPQSRRRKAERLIAEAKINAAWMDPPTADDVRALDRQRFLEDPLLNEETSEEDRAMAELVLTKRTPEDIAAILAKLYRSRLPEPEELADPEQFHQPRQERGSERGQERDRGRRGNERDERPDRARKERGPREDRGPREAPRSDFARSDSPRGDFQRDDRFGEPEPLTPNGENLVFKMDIGRKQKADPKWLLPMICRRGNVTRREIGTIRIFEDRTEFEINRDAAEHFTLHASRKDGEDIRISPVDGSSQSTDAPRKPSFKPRDKAPYEKTGGRDFAAGRPQKPSYDKPSYDKPRQDRPAYDSKPVAYEDRAPYQDRAPRQDGPPGQGTWAKKDKPSYQNRAASPARTEYSDRPAYKDRAPRTDGAPRDEFADRSPMSVRPSFEGGGKKKPFAGKKPFGNPAGDKKPFGKGPKPHNRSGFAQRKKSD